MIEIKVNEIIDVRQFKDDDGSELFALIENNRNYLCHWLSKQTLCTTLDETVSLIRWGLMMSRENGSFEAGLWIGGRLGGAVGLHLIDWQRRHSDIGYWLVPDFQGKGFMTMAVRAVVDYAFGRYELKTLSIRCPTHNYKSRAIAERLGFQLETIKPRYVSRGSNGQTTDVAIYLISYEQWEQSKEGKSPHGVPFGTLGAKRIP